ncbi:hypothetical protein DVH05_014395 [Phytophthora capsici]|nr:hypothetical protein DVH05_014395 [Phytophthora capsici]
MGFRFVEATNTLTLTNDLFTIPDGVFYLSDLEELRLTGNLALSRSFTIAQVKFLQDRKWNVGEDDFVHLDNCGSRLGQIHNITVCIVNDGAESRPAHLRKLVEDKYACSGHLSGGEIAALIVGVIVVMLIVNGFVYLWKKHQVT